jgi:hypothetical protein
MLRDILIYFTEYKCKILCKIISHLRIFTIVLETGTLMIRTVPFLRNQNNIPSQNNCHFKNKSLFFNILLLESLFKRQAVQQRFINEKPT